MKTTYGYKWWECRNTGEYRTCWMEVYSIREFDLLAAIARATEQGDERRLAGLTAIAVKAAGRQVYCVDDGNAHLTYQAEASASEWSCASLGLPLGTPYGESEGDVHKAILKVALKGNATRPIDLAKALKAIPIDTLRGADDHSLRIGTGYAYVQTDCVGPRMVNPNAGAVADAA